MHWLIVIVSHIISVLTISLCFVMKVPQIVRLWKAGTAAGQSFKAILLELSSYSITMMYNYTNRHSILTYLEYPILIVQDFIVVAIVLYFTRSEITKYLLIVLGYSIFFLAFGSGILNKSILLVLLPLTVPASVLSKVMQLITIIRNQNADSVSKTTWALSTFTNVTRIFTVYFDSRDVTLLCNFGISALFSTAVLVATIYYQMRSRRISEIKQE